MNFRPVGKESFIVHEGTRGLFTPLAAAAGGNRIDPNGEANLEEIIAALKQELARVQKENEQLKGQIKAMRASSSRPPDDFASAVSHSLDTLQSRMTQMANPVTDFVVREFSVEAKVHIDVTPLGTFEYKFIDPGEDVDPQKISRIGMTIVPVPKQTAAGSWTRPDFTPFLGVEEIQGIGENYRKLLNKHQIFTVGDLLTAGSRVRSSVELASMLKVDRERLGHWLSHAQLLTVRDVDGRTAEVLFASGIKGLKDLAELTPEELVKTFNERVTKLGHKNLKHITPAQAETWIKTAQSYIGRGLTPTAPTDKEK